MNLPPESRRALLAKAAVMDGAQTPQTQVEAGTEVHAAFVRLRRSHLLEGGGYEAVIELVESWPDKVRPSYAEIAKAAANVFGAPVEDSKGRIVLRSHADRDRDRRMPGPMIVNELAPEGGVCAFIALPGVGKTLLGIELARCVAAGEPFAGHAVTQGSVVYAGVDSAASTERRLLAVGEETNSRIFTITEMPLLPASIDKLGIAVREVNAKSDLPVRLVVLDTWDSCRAHSSGGYADQDGGAEEMMRGMRKLAADHRLAVLIVHHATRQDAGRARGSLVFDARCDWIAVVEKGGAGLILRTTKARDGVCGPVGTWAIRPVTIEERAVPTLVEATMNLKEMAEQDQGREMLEAARTMADSGKKPTARALARAIGKSKNMGLVDRLAGKLRQRGLMARGSYVPTQAGREYLDEIPAESKHTPEQAVPEEQTTGTGEDSLGKTKCPAGTKPQNNHHTVPPSHTYKGGTGRDSGTPGDEPSDDLEDLYANAPFARRTRP